MTEMILLLPGANGTELTRMLARFNKSTIGLRMMNAAEFARFALMRSGVVLEESFLPRKQEAAVIDRFIRTIDYFSSAGYTDSEKVADAMYSLRCLIPNQEYDTIHNQLPKGKFSEKNTSLVEVYDQYLADLEKAGNVDTVGLIRKAMAAAKPLSCEVHTLQEYPLTPLEEALLSKLSVKRVHSCLHDLLGVKPVALRNIDYTKSYGSSNEVAAIYDYILKNNLHFDQSVVAVTNTAKYGQLFYDFSQSHNLPITLGCGVPILNSNPARLLKLIFDWDNAGYHGVDALREMLCSDATDRKKLQDVLEIAEKPWLLEKIIDTAGRLRLNFDRLENKRKIAQLPKGKEDEAVYAGVAALSKELALGQRGFVEKYALIRKEAVDRMDCSARSVICDALDAYARYTDGSSLNQIIPSLLQGAVCSENSREGALFVTGISGAIASMRKHLFVAGMSATNFPGMPRENYLLLDCDYRMFADQNTAPTSVNLVRRKKTVLEHLLALASALDVNIHLSYSGYNLADMKEENPSAVLFDIFKQQHGEETTLQQYEAAFQPVGYFDQQVTDDYQVGRAYVAGKEIRCRKASHTAAPATTDRAFAPTAIEEFFQCPRRFYLTKILGVKQPEVDDPFVVIDHREFGTLAHTVMKSLADARCDEETFLKRADAVFEEFLRNRPPIHPDAAVKEKKTFMNMMKIAYDTDPGNTVLSAEERKECVHSCGIKLEGYPDRVEQISGERYIIADYKTGKNVKHRQDDIDTCLQAVIYAYMLEQQGVAISGCEYRYLRTGTTIPCRYDADMKEKLNDKLQIFKDALDDGNFPYGTEKDVCKYCKLKGVCDKETDMEEDEE